VHPKKGKPATLKQALSGIHDFDYTPFSGEGQVVLRKSINNSKDDVDNEDQKTLNQQIRQSLVRLSPAEQSENTQLIQHPKEKQPMATATTTTTQARPKA
jgi:hypothetical protein